MDLSKMREEIDKLDSKLIKILSERRKLVRDVAKYKQKNNIQALQEKRMEDMFQKRRDLARELDLDPDFIEHIFLDIVNESIKIQKNLIGKR